MNPLYDALDEAGHLYGLLFSKPLIRYPKLVLEPFIPGPLQEKTSTTEYIHQLFPSARLAGEGERERVCSPVYASACSDFPF